MKALIEFLNCHIEYDIYYADETLICVTNEFGMDSLIRFEL